MKKYDLTYEIRGLVPKTVIVALQEELTITEDVDSEVDRAAGQFGYYAVLAEKAESRYDRLKLQYELWESDNQTAKDEDNVEKSEKKYTGPQMKAYILSLPKYKSYQMKLIELREQRNILRAVAKAFDKKADLVQTKACNRRSESRK